jgi:Arc/MetJ-type ribon-helix-helix transcriptional regulator
MSGDENTLSERVGARISPELKARVHEAIAKHGFDSEADVVRAALWLYVEQPESAATPVKADERPINPDHHEAPSNDRLEWALTVVVILVAIVGSKILNAVREEKIKPAELADEAIQEAVYNWKVLWKRLRAGREASFHLDHHEVEDVTH